MLGFDRINNRGQAGRQMQDITWAAVAAGAPEHWTPGTDRGVVIVQGLGNNLLAEDTPRNRAAALEGLRALVAYLSASSTVPHSGWTFGAGWNDVSVQPYASTGTARIGQGDALTADISVPAGTAYVLAHGTDGELAPGQRIEVTQDGRTVGVKSLNGVTARTGNEANNGAAPVVLRLDDLEAGVARLTTRQDIPGGIAILDTLLPQASKPPLIVLVRNPAILAPSHDKPALAAYLNTLPGIVAAEFGEHVIVADPAPGWDPATMLGADKLHPTPQGADHMSRAVVSAVKARIWRAIVEGLALSRVG